MWNDCPIILPGLEVQEMDRRCHYILRKELPDFNSRADVKGEICAVTWEL